MHLLITAKSNDLEASVDPRFGRCPYFLVVDTDNMEYEAKENTHANSSSGAGVQAAQDVIGEDVEAVLTGNVGPNAFQALQAGGVKIYTGAQGTVKDAIEDFQEGRLQETTEPTARGGRGKGRSSG